MSHLVDAVRAAEEAFVGLPDFPWDARWREWQGLRLAHLDEGDGYPVVFVHGEPTEPSPRVQAVVRGHDQFFVNFGDSSKRVATRRSVAYWAPLEEARRFRDLNEVRDRLALPEQWETGGEFQRKDQVLISRIPAGGESVRVHGTANEQVRVPDPRPGQGQQSFFTEFDGQWIAARLRIDDFLAGHLPKLPGLPEQGPP